MFEKLDTPEEIFSFKLGAALTMEKKLLEVLEEFEAAAQRPEVKQALHQHHQETEQHVVTLEQCFRLLGEEADDSPCPTVEAMAKEGKANLKKTDESVIDAVVLSAATESEHHEIAVYETLIVNADARGATEVAQLLRQILEDENQALATARARMRTIAQEGIAVGTH